MVNQSLQETKNLILIKNSSAWAKLDFTNFVKVVEILFPKVIGKISTKI